ncbi:hypothetical protein [Vibrio profundum]|uniref:hypothetical protein n=1 Tax=Vibrio profundum TaxID=2910247 RepID=UPI003D096FFF
MVLYTCTIEFNNKQTVRCSTVEQSLGVIEAQPSNNISSVILDVADGQHIKTYRDLTLEESIESLMSL